MDAGSARRFATLFAFASVIALTACGGGGSSGPSGALFAGGASQAGPVLQTGPNLSPSADAFTKTQLSALSAMGSLAAATPPPAIAPQTPLALEAANVVSLGALPQSVRRVLPLFTTTPGCANGDPKPACHDYLGVQWSNGALPVAPIEACMDESAWPAYTLPATSAQGPYTIYGGTMFAPIWAVNADGSYSVNDLEISTAYWPGVPHELVTVIAQDAAIPMDAFFIAHYLRTASDGYPKYHACVIRNPSDKLWYALIYDYAKQVWSVIAKDAGTPATSWTSVAQQYGWNVLESYVPVGVQCPPLPIVKGETTIWSESGGALQPWQMTSSGNGAWPASSSGGCVGASSGQYALTFDGSAGEYGSWWTHTNL